LQLLNQHLLLGGVLAHLDKRACDAEQRPRVEHSHRTHAEPHSLLKSKQNDQFLLLVRVGRWRVGACRVARVARRGARATSPSARASRRRGRRRAPTPLGRAHACHSVGHAASQGSRLDGLASVLGDACIRCVGLLVVRDNGAHVMFEPVAEAAADDRRSASASCWPL